jgi:RhtB (resistance to homoserine/threonine) family protein
VGVELVPFLAIAIVVIAVPGQDTALTIRNTLLGGRRAGLSTALGIAAGLAVWTAAASAGVVALLVAAEPVFLALRIAGAAYLVYLGIQSLRAALARRQAHAGPTTGATVRPTRALRQGFLSNLGNPKIAVFFAALLPQFVPEGGGSFAALLLLGLLFCLLTLLWLSLYSVAIDRARTVLERPRIRRTLDAITGTVLVAFGVRLAVAAR